MKEEKVYDREEEFPGYPVYPESEDIFNKQTREEDINPDEVSERSLPNIPRELKVQSQEDYDIVETELDIPGSELDDVQESIGAEDEENNYYSLGGDNHQSLEEDNEG